MDKSSVAHRSIGRVIIFNDPAYPQACSEEFLNTLVPGPFVTAEATDLAAKLTDDCTTLISFHGPYFPRQAWPSILRFLQRGGNLAVLGGVPFTRPVDPDYRVESEQQSYTRQLFLGPYFQVEKSESQVTLLPAEAAACLQGWTRPLPVNEAGTFWSLDPKLTQALDHPEELGSSGPLDTLLTPLVYATTADNKVQRSTRIAAPFLLLDQKEGHFRGGRWLISAWQPSSNNFWLENSETIQKLLSLTIAGFAFLEVDPALATLSSGETAVVVVKARTNSALNAMLTLTNPAHEQQSFEVEFEASDFPQEKRLTLPAGSRPGLYRIETTYQGQEGLALRQETGFWVWDERLVEQTKGKRLSAGRDYFYQGDKLFLVYGTTYMDSVNQRRFLTLPNPARWDNDFAEMKAAGINLVRTGIWTAWRQFMPVAGVANEVALRALDAFVMTACKYDIQLIFTFFSFYPPLFEGDNPWLDPRSVRGQQEYVSAIARRYAEVELVQWDLINEPSFGAPEKIFAQRPIPCYDRFELAAFRQWLSERYSLNELQRRWSLTADALDCWEQVSLPQPEDYSTDVRNNNQRKMVKVGDYTLFSQEMFSRWSAEMYRTIRAAGSRTVVGVGQDEAGVRIAPQFYASSVDYTTTHPWWNNDALLWDMLLDKTPFKPNLIQETGVMLVTDVDGTPWRTPRENANLLERKLFTGLLARGAGFIQWLWHTNSYMTSDNENSIGLVRADGSAKPELEVMQELGRLVQALEGQLEEAAQLPRVWLIIPYSQWALRPELGIEATQKAVRALCYDLGIIPQLVGEQQLAIVVESGQQPEVVIVPGAQFFSREGWEALQRLAQKGVTVVVSGALRSFDTGRFPGLLPITGGDDQERLLPVSRYEQVTDLEGQSHQLTFEGEKIGYVQKANNQCQVIRTGKGRIIRCGVPLELAGNSAVIGAFYRQFLNWKGDTWQKESPVLVSRLTLKEGELVIAVSESAVTQRIKLSDGLEIEIAPNRAGAIMLQESRPVAIFGGLEALPVKTSSRA
ncbi:MAG TPA: beta-galactosidase [Chloroflexia bacterium]|nr:beta-galactosidase [Chloroflexia bacterium]